MQLKARSGFFCEYPSNAPFHIYFYKPAKASKQIHVVFAYLAHIPEKRSIRKRKMKMLFSNVPEKVCRKIRYFANRH
jgi:hypothetical protein